MDRVGPTRRELLPGLPPAARQALVGAIALGVAGGVVGLVLGLRAYPPTAWAAVFEVGLPAAFVGGLLGPVLGSLMRPPRTRSRRSS